MRCKTRMESETFPMEYTNSPFDKAIESIDLLWPIFQWTLFDSIGQPSVVSSWSTQVFNANPHGCQTNFLNEKWNIKQLSCIVNGLKIISWTLCLLFLPASLQENNVGQTAVDRHAINTHVSPLPRLFLCCILVGCGFSLYDRNHDERTQVQLVTHKRWCLTALAVKRKPMAF